MPPETTHDNLARLMKAADDRPMLASPWALFAHALESAFREGRLVARDAPNGEEYARGVNDAVKAAQDYMLDPPYINHCRTLIGNDQLNGLCEYIRASLIKDNPHE
jgi:hypothetical protein